MARGIDYGMGQTNIDRETGIRYGVINMNALAYWAWDEMEPDYGLPRCSKCGDEAVVSDHEDVPDVCSDEAEAWEITGCHDFACIGCKRIFGAEDAYPEEVLGHHYDQGGIQITVGTDGDAFILKSPFKTRAQYCSPCAPGACYLESPCEDGEWAYCLDQSWFDKDRPCPYPVYDVQTGELLYTPPKEEDEGSDQT